jgi:hypothetical protein
MLALGEGEGFSQLHTTSFFEAIVDKFSILNYRFTLAYFIHYWTTFFVSQGGN